MHKILLIILIILTKKINAISPKEEINSDSLDYSDELYRELAEEYELSKTPTETEDMLDDENGTSAEGSKNDIDMIDEDEEESFKEAIVRLSCENPWFWNSFKCLWLDVKKKVHLPRTKRNAITVAWILGPPFIILVIFICGSCLVTIYLKAKVREFSRKIDEMREKYEPGSITLDDGKVRKYQPTQEEIDAFENLISTLVSVV